MKKERSISILFPYYEDIEYKQLSPTTCHDLALDELCKELTYDKKEQRMIMSILSNMTSDKRVAYYRQKVFEDILRLEHVRKRMTELFDRIEFLKNFGTMKRSSDEKLGIWGLLHRLDELGDYIECIEAMRECLSQADIRSEGLITFRKFVDTLYEDSCFSEMKEDIAKLKMKTSDIKSVTIGINLNDKFEAVSIGLVSVNKKFFKKSGVLSNFVDAFTLKNNIKNDTEWNGNMIYHQAEINSDEFFNSLERNSAFYAMQTTPFIDRRIVSTVSNIPEGDELKNTTFYLEKVTNKLLDNIVKKLNDVLSKYVDVSVINISKVMPEFLYYIKFAEFIEKNTADNLPFCEPELIDGEESSMITKDFYNLKLALNLKGNNDIVYNDLIFDKENTVYILTGANRGGKTTVTQAIGIMFVLAQGGIFVPAGSFGYKPVDCIYTHFPADEDKTMDLGRLGEECVRFKEIFSSCTGESLVLLNETFSTTSFEEGCYIAEDCVKALLKKKVRTIYNTHIHKLAADINEINSGDYEVLASSLIVKNDGKKRSFKIEKAAPEGMSYARDIAEKYGVTLDMLTKEI